MTADTSGFRFLHPTDERKRRRAIYGNRRWELTRRLVLARDKGVCHWCGKAADRVDHLTDPLTDTAGRYAVANCVASCRSCNARRGRPGFGEQPRRDPMTVLAGYAPRPAPVESPCIVPPGGSVRPASGDARYIAWVLELPLVPDEPDDHQHRPWSVVNQVHVRGAVFALCPASCTHPAVRWTARPSR
jgi:hypothetical protein